VTIAEGKSGANEPNIFSSGCDACLLPSSVFGRNNVEGGLNQRDCDWLVEFLQNRYSLTKIFLEKSVFCLEGLLGLNNGNLLTGTMFTHMNDEPFL